MHAPYQRTRRAHAKINLLLRVLAQEASGYHGVETLLQRIALHDIVHVSVHGATRTILCDGPTMPPGGFGPAEDNLAFRAAVAFAEATSWPAGFQIAIEKHIPVGGGLGGGSTDAAAVLRALNAMCPHPLTETALLSVGSSLGSDVPFFVSDVSLAFAWNRGDRMLALPALPAMRVSLLAQSHGVDTGAAYRALDAMPVDAREGAPSTAVVYAAQAFSDWAHIARVARNDFERVVPALHEGVANALQAVQQAAAIVRTNGHQAFGMMSGSGATCFVLTPLAVTPSLSASLGICLESETTI